MLSTFPPSPTRVQTIGKRSATMRWLALAGIIGPILFVALIALADVLQYHFLLRYGYSPVTESPVSVNALGPYGWIQESNFFVFGLLEMLFAVGLYRSVKGGRLAKITSVGFVFLLGISMLLSVFPTDNFSWFYVWLLVFPMTWLELVAIRLWVLASKQGTTSSHSIHLSALKRDKTSHA